VRLLFFLSTCAIFTLQAQNRVADRVLDDTKQISIGPGLLSISCHAQAFEPKLGPTVYLFEFRNLHDSSLLCTLIDTIEGWSGPTEYRFSDMNFDGYQDLSYIVETDARGGHEWRTALFDRRLNRFVFSRSFSELPDDIHIDSTDHSITYSNYSFYDERRITTDWRFVVIEGDLCLSKVVSITEILKGEEDWVQSKKETEEYAYQVSNHQPLPISKKVVLEMAEDGKVTTTTDLYEYVGGRYRKLSKSKPIR